MSSDLILICVVAILIGYRMYQRRKIDRAIGQSSVFEATPIRVNGTRRQCQRAEAIVIDQGWRKVSDERWRVFWRTCRFVPAGDGAAKPQEVLTALDRPTEISKIELPGWSKPKGS